MPERSPVLTGKCMCGAVEYAVDDAFEYSMNCHCSNCRRTTGSAFKPFAGIGRDKLRLVKGEDASLIYGDGDDAHDVHCNTCGSLLYSVVREGAYVHVAMGTLVDAPTIRPTGHIFVAVVRDHRRSAAVSGVSGGLRLYFFRAALAHGSVILALVAGIQPPRVGAAKGLIA